MRRNVIFEKGRRWRVDDDQVQDLRLEPGRGAAIGEYMYPESSEYSDSYYGPGRQPRADYPSGPPVGDVTRHPPHARSMNYISANRFSSGELRPGARSWADLGVSSVHPGEAGITEREGPYRGLGPKGYRRSDERLKEIICEQLTNDPYVDASDIEVAVKSGEVTLTGSVSDRRAKWRAEDLAEACTGGAEVHNRLRVQR
jgi:BON domain